MQSTDLFAPQQPGINLALQDSTKDDTFYVPEPKTDEILEEHLELVEAISSDDWLAEYREYVRETLPADCMATVYQGGQLMYEIPASQMYAELLG